jgi:transposase
MKEIHFDVHVPKVRCPVCNSTRQIDLKIAGKRKSYTNAFARSVILEFRNSPLSRVAKTFGIDWHTANGILQDYLAARTGPKLSKLEQIAIDEIFLGRTQKYFTIVMNLKTSDIVFVGEGRAERSLAPFWEMLGRRKANIKVVCMDMGAAYQKAVRENLPNAEIVIDHFHVIKLVNDRVDRLRRSLFLTCPKVHRNVIKGCRYLLLKNEANLEPSGKERERLERLLALNTPLTEAYLLKESMRQVWKKTCLEEAKPSLDGWIESALRSECHQLVSLGRSIERHREGILNYFVHFVTSGPIESMNNKIKVLVRRAHGYRNPTHFKRLLYAINEFDPRIILR